MKILIINGPNLNMLGRREPKIYGTESYRGIIASIRRECRARHIKAAFFQSNEEGKIVTRIQKAAGVFDAIMLNAGAYTHTSLAILDALRCAGLPCVEVHVSDPALREPYRAFSYISEYAFAVVKGEGAHGYITALDKLSEHLENSARA